MTRHAVPATGTALAPTAAPASTTATAGGIDLPRLSTIALLLVLLSGAINTGVSWSRCALGHWHGHVHAADVMCVIAGLGAFAATIAFAVHGARALRRNARTRELLVIDAALLTLGFAGGSLQLQLLDVLGLGFHAYQGMPTAGLGPQALHQIGTIAGTWLTLELLRLAGRMRRGESAGLRGRAALGGLGAVIVGWAVAAVLAGGALGPTALSWIIDPIPTLACFAAGALAAVFATARRRSITTASGTDSPLDVATNAATPTVDAAATHRAA